MSGVIFPPCTSVTLVYQKTLKVKLLLLLFENEKNKSMKYQIKKPVKEGSGLYSD